MSVKTVLVSEVDGDGAVISEGVVTSSTTCEADRVDLCCGNLFQCKIDCIDKDHKRQTCCYARRLRRGLWQSLARESPVWVRMRVGTELVHRMVT